MRHAFSLVELSIVLVILGLLTGGILAGQSLIRAAELRAISTEYQRYIAAGHAFRDKYMGIPGDFRDGTKFWGRQTTNANCVTNSGAAENLTTGVCDGNGNGRIDSGGSAASPKEGFQFWRQLVMAGLIEGTYNGTAGSGSSVHTSTSNAPSSRLSSGLWFVADRDALMATSASVFFDITHGNALQIGGLDASGSPYRAIITPEEAWNTDTKMDDGRPGRGKVVAARWDDCTDATANTQIDASYLLSDNTKLCILEFPQIF